MKCKITSGNQILITNNYASEAFSFFLNRNLIDFYLTALDACEMNLLIIMYD